MISVAITLLHTGSFHNLLIPGGECKASERNEDQRIVLVRVKPRAVRYFSRQTLPLAPKTIPKSNPDMSRPVSSSPSPNTNTARQFRAKASSSIPTPRSVIRLYSAHTPPNRKAGQDQPTLTSSVEP